MSNIPWPPEVEAVLVLAPASVRDAIGVVERVGDRAIELGGRRPSPPVAQRLLLSSIVRAGGTSNDVRFLVTHGLADELDVLEFEQKYPHAAR